MISCSGPIEWRTEQGPVCGVRMFDTGLRIFGESVYFGVSYFVSRHYIFYFSGDGTASLERLS